MLDFDGDSKFINIGLNRWLLYGNRHDACIRFVVQVREVDRTRPLFLIAIPFSVFKISGVLGTGWPQYNIMLDEAEVACKSYFV